MGAAGVDRDFEFPAELLVGPQALVGIAGLDTLNNPFHRSVWDALSASRRPDRPPIQFKLLAAAHEFPHPKAKKPYGAHIPKGLLKRSWMHKHLTQVPAVVAVFYDLDWDEPQWEERRVECVARVRAVREALGHRATRLCLVLIQRTPLNPTSPADPVAEKRADQVFVSAGLSSKSLYILPHNEHLLGFTSKLETVFYDWAKTYYQQEIRTIKSHREELNKKNHQYLFVRHHFKIGFFSELRQDLTTAHSNYDEAYNGLLEVRLSDTNEFEVKTVAGYISYKVSRVQFALDRPREAISHFTAHIEHYRLKTGHALLLFQHYAWLAKQYSMFGELLEEMAHRRGVPFVQTQHPGVYYKSAAQYSERRKVVAAQLCRGVEAYPEPDPLAGADKLEYYGQRAWRPCQLSAEPLDPDLEHKGITAIQYNEHFKVDESAIIIGLLGNAISQYKKYKCPRMRRHLVVRMADEYYEAKDYGKSLTLLTHMLWDYRVDKWYSIVDVLLVKALATAFLSVAVSEYLTLCLEAMSRSGPVEAARVTANLVAVGGGGVPAPEPNLSAEEVAEALAKWDGAVAADKVVVDASLFVPPVQLKAAIVRHDYDHLEVELVLRSQLPVPITFSSLVVVLSHGGGPPRLSHHPATGTDSTTLVPDELQTFTAHIRPQPTDVAQVVHISSVQLSLGTVPGRTVVLSYSGSGTDPTSTYPELMFFKQLEGRDLAFSRVKPSLVSLVSRREPLVTLKMAHRAPALLHEWYPLTVTLDNHETTPITDAFLTLQTTADLQLTKLADSSTTFKFPANVKVELNSPKWSRTFFVKCESATSRQVEAKLSYIVEGSCCVCETSVTFAVQKPFGHSSWLVAANGERVEEVFSLEAFRLENWLTSRSPWPVRLHSARLELERRLSGPSQTGECSLSGVQLNEGEGAVDVRSVVCESTARVAVPLGELVVTWSRHSEEVKVTTTTFPLPKVNVAATGLSLEVTTPGSGVLRRLYPVRYRLTNRTDRLLALHLTVNPSDSFMFAGTKESEIHLQPATARVLDYNMFPLFVGPMELPKLQLRSLDGSVPQLDELVARAVPPSVYIFPQSFPPGQTELAAQ